MDKLKKFVPASEIKLANNHVQYVGDDLTVTMDKDGKIRVTAWSKTATWLIQNLCEGAPFP